MIEYRYNKCPLCGGKISKDELHCFNGDCALGQFTVYRYKDGDKSYKVSGLYGIEEIEEKKDESVINSVE